MLLYGFCRFVNYCKLQVCTGREKEIWGFERKDCSMGKKWLTIAASGALSFLMAMPVMAAEWKWDASGWWYVYDDGSYATDTWEWIDRRRYYFDEQGYCVRDAVTPDGYTVNEDGQWIVDGTVQIQELEESIGPLVFSVPSEFLKSETLSTPLFHYYINEPMDLILGVVSEEFQDPDGYKHLSESRKEAVLDRVMQVFGSIEEKRACTFQTGKWYCYRYPDQEFSGVSGKVYAYARIQEASLLMVVFAGNTDSTDMDGIVDQSFR